MTLFLSKRTKLITFSFLLFLTVTRSSIECKTKKSGAESTLKSEKKLASVVAKTNSSSDVREKRNLQSSYYGAGGGSAPNFSSHSFDHQQQHHYHHHDAPEPIIEIIIQDNNETLPPPEPIVLAADGKPKKEQVQVFYVKYKKDEHDQLIIDNPVAALSPHSHQQDNEHEDQVGHQQQAVTYVTPSPIKRKTTTLRTIIRPDSKTYESNSGVHVTFDTPDNYNSKSDKHIGDASEKHESFTHPRVDLGSVSKDKRNSQFFIPNTPPPNFNSNHNNFPPPSQPQQQNNNNNFNPNFEIPSHQHRFSQQPPSHEPLRNFHPSQQPQPNFNQKPQALLNPYQNQQQQLPFHHQQQQFRQPISAHRPSQVLSHPQHIQQNFSPSNSNNVKFPSVYTSNPYHHHQQQLPIKNAQNFHPQPAAPSFNFNNNQTPQQIQPLQNQQQPPHFAQRQQFKVQTSQQQHPSITNNFINQQHPPVPEKPIQFIHPNIKYHQAPSTPPFTHHAQIPITQKFNNNEQVSNGNVFQGGLVQQAAPNLVNNKHEQQISPQKNANSLIKQAFGGDVQVQASQTKFEHHVTEQLNAPVFIPSIDMDFTKNRYNQPQQQQYQQQYNIQQHPPQQQQHNSVQFVDHSFQNPKESGIFPRQKSNDVLNEKPQAQTANFDISNFKIPHQTTARYYSIPSSSPAPTAAQVTKILTIATTVSPPRAPPAAIAQLPDEVPDDLRQQLLSSGILENAQISILDYDKIGATNIQDLPAEHLEQFLGAGGGSLAGSEQVLRVAKPEDNSKHFSAIKKDTGVKIKEAIKSETNHGFDGTVKKTKYSRYESFKISGDNFPLPNFEELQNKIVKKVVILTPITNEEDESGLQSEVKRQKINSDELLRNLLRKQSTYNFEQWLKKEEMKKSEDQSVILLLTFDIQNYDEDIFMYDVTTKTANRLDGELSRKFIKMAKDSSSESDDEFDAAPASSEIIETYLKPEIMKEEKVVINSGYSNIKSL